MSLHAIVQLLLLRSSILLIPVLQKDVRYQFIQNRMHVTMDKTTCKLRIMYAIFMYSTNLIEY